jgi:hypothetical protein
MLGTFIKKVLQRRAQSRREVNAELNVEDRGWFRVDGQAKTDRSLSDDDGTSLDWEQRIGNW